MTDLAILIPTVNRPEKLQPLLDNVHEVTQLAQRAYEVYFIAEYSDGLTRQALGGLRGHHKAVFGDFGSCARAMNAGFVASTEEFVFTGNDDLRFHWDWWQEARAKLYEDGKHICGTNDGNGRMTCFALARRSYIAEHSGVFDKPATLYHEYASQYVDTEFADYAKARGVWTEAPESVTEHLHWEFGKANQDHPNYRKARSTCADDHATYRERKPLWEAAASGG